MPRYNLRSQTPKKREAEVHVARSPVSSDGGNSVSSEEDEVEFVAHHEENVEINRMERAKTLAHEFLTTGLASFHRLFSVWACIPILFMILCTVLPYQIGKVVFTQTPLQLPPDQHTDLGHLDRIVARQVQHAISARLGEMEAEHLKQIETFSTAHREVERKWNELMNENKLESLEEQILRLTADIASIVEKEQDTIKAVAKSINELQEQYSNLRGDLELSTATVPNADTPMTPEQLPALIRSVHSLEKKYKDIRDSHDDLTNLAKDAEQTSQQLIELNRSVTTLEEQYRDLLPRQIEVTAETFDMARLNQSVQTLEERIDLLVHPAESNSVDLELQEAIINLTEKYKSLSEVNVTSNDSPRLFELIASQKSLEEKVVALSRSIEPRPSEIQEQLHALQKNCSLLMDSTKTPEVSTDGLPAVRKMISESLERYDADKVGRIDFASARNNAHIAYTVSDLKGDLQVPWLRQLRSWFTTDELLTSATYTRNGMWKWCNWLRTGIFGCTVDNPTVALEENVKVGSCWPIRGNQGRLTVQFGSPIFPDSVTLDYPSKLITHQRTSTPKTFQIWGYTLNYIRIPLGNFTYDIDGIASQTFELPSSTVACRAIELQVNSNYGHPDYTCVYRFRAHGELK